MSQSSFFENDNPLRLWYLEPSSRIPYIKSYDNDIWQQNTLPIGNGFIGANVFGEIQNEVLTFNELTLWHGGPSPKRPNYKGGNNPEKGKNGLTFRKIQQLFSEGKDKEAESLCNELVGDRDGYGSYIEFGRIKIDFDINEKDVKNYVRWLDINQAITYVQYEYEGSVITREYFVSYPDNVLVIHVKTTGQKMPNFTVSFDTQTKSKSEQKAINNEIRFKGRLDDNQMIFNFILKASSEKGSIDVLNEKSLSIKESNDVYFYVSAATDYKDVYPNYRTGESEIDVENRVYNVVNKAIEKGYESIRKDHIEDYTKLFSRVSLDLGQTASKFPTNQQLQNYKEGKDTFEEARDLEVLLFQYGRYLTIECSREKGLLPSNLQGIWNDKVEGVPWMSDYHMNINLQMNYWPTFVTNLHECAIPLINYVEGLRIPGRISAEIYTGVVSNEEKPENGFMAHTQNTPFGWTCPGWDFSWGWSPAAIPWILQNVFDYYLFTKDEEMLRKRIYPMMKETCTLYEQIMVYSKRYDRLVSSPTYSPEQGPRTEGNAYEQELIWQHYHNTIKAARILNIDNDLINKWEEIIKQLKPIEIGDSGQIKEWYNETSLGSIGSKNHRHLSHLLGLYPGDLISIDNVEWLNAAIISLVDRGDKSTGWGMGQRINAWARTGNGNHAYKLLHNLITNGIYNNLWDLHPPFQIDGNFGATSGIAEMLLQSNLGYINILPSLPDVWMSGKFDGLVARGNIIVGVTWEKKCPVEVRLNTVFSNDVIIECKGINNAKIIDKEGKIISYSALSENRISFKSKEGDFYIIKLVKNK